MSMTSTAVARPVATMMVFLVIVVLGLAGLRFLPIDLLPPIEFPQLTVAVDYPNVGPEEIEQIITRPIENAVGGIQGVERIRSRSEEGESRVTLDFSRGTNIDAAANDLRAALDPIRDNLPPEVEPPRVWKFDPNNVSIVVIGATSSVRDLQELTLIIEREITRRFEQVPGVGSIGIYGGVHRNVHVDLKRDRLNASRLSSVDVRRALASSNANLPGGNVSQGTQSLYVRTLGEYQSLEAIRETVITSVEGKPIRVSDVAEVSFGYDDLQRVVEIDGKPMLRFGVRKQSGANTVTVAAAIRAEVERINQDRHDIELFVAQDQSTFIQQSIDTVRQSMGWGALLAVFVLYAFLRQSSSTIIIAVAIPISIIATFGLLYFNGLTLNQMSFGGLALGVGLVVDNAVVVLENIVRQRENGRDPEEASLIGTQQVAGAIVASTLTTAVIFLPVVFMQTITGVIFQQLALVVVFSLLCSLLVALTLVPMLASKFLSINSATGESATPSRHFFGTVEEKYGRLLDFSLRHRIWVLVITTALVGASALSAPLIPVELAPQTDSNEIDIDLRMASGTNIAVVNVYLRQLAELVRANLPEDAVLYFRTDVRDGRAEVELTMAEDSPISSSVLADHLREATDGLIPGGDIRVQSQSGLWILRRMFSSGGGEDVDIEIRGHDLALAQEVGHRMKDAIEQIPGIKGVRLEDSRGRPESNITFDRAKLAAFNLTVQDVAQVIQTNVGGSRAGSYRVGGDEFPIIVRLRAEDRQSTQNLDNISIRLPSGEVIPISAVISKETGYGPPEINRIDGQRVTRLSANLESGMALGDAVEAVRTRLAEISLPPGISIIYSGEYQEQQKAAADFRLSLAIALLLIYMVMSGQFERFLDPLIVLFAVPLAIIGVVPTLLVTGTTINMQSLMGVIMLTGIVVNNAIVLVDYINLLRREEGLDIVEAVRRAGRRRLRPIMMTTTTTVLGLLPLSLGIGVGAEIQAALARVVLGGLLASALVTLVFIPVLYLTCYQGLERLRAWRTGHTDSASEPAAGIQIS
ncbi:MAG: efflux RND transporter permease subunit [Proteobacteria bacterium]|jgi:HAE1 family hydrophobic/amphiphilic exporter-1|nr:efflux RND transporter permease subunit [Pseudomonadota bacterium]MDA1300558.1 efflux RND transporter permease subunit [Pseudomonadota bacterium]